MAFLVISLAFFGDLVGVLGSRWRSLVISLAFLVISLAFLVISLAFFGDLVGVLVAFLVISLAFLVISSLAFLVISVEVLVISVAVLVNFQEFYGLCSVNIIS